MKKIEIALISGTAMASVMMTHQAMAATTPLAMAEMPANKGSAAIAAWQRPVARTRPTHGLDINALTHAQNDAQAAGVPIGDQNVAANEKGVGPVVETQLGETGGLQDIVVTAQRRSESLQNVPISVAAFTGETLTQRGLNSTEALQAGVPGLVMTRQISGATPFLRGVGTPTVSAGIESPVATYVDGVYYAESIGSIFSFNNVERVEVLKGPQGTLYGRNSTGGLINVVTRDPRSEFSLEGSVSYANFDQKSLSAYMTGGSGNLSADIAAYVVRQSDGYGRNITTGREVGKEHATYLRSKVLWEPSDQDRFVASFDFSRDRTDLGSAIDAAPDSILTDGQSSTGRSHDIRSDQDPRQNTRTWGANVRYVRDLGWGSFSSLSAYRNVKSAFTLDVDGTATALLPTTTSVVSRSFQQELLLQGKGDRFNWTAGLFVFDVRAGFVPNQFGPSLLPFLNYDVFAIQNTHSYAAFLDGGYKLSDQTTVTAGIRYTIDQREFSGRTVARTGNSEPIGTILTSGAGKKTFKRPSWRLVADSDDAAHLFRSDRAHHSELMPPGRECLIDGLVCH